MKEFLSPGRYVDSDHPDVVAFARKHAKGATDLERAVSLYYAVRDAVRYNPFLDFTRDETFRGSVCLATGEGFCIGKAALLAACARAVGIPARVGFADVKNHLTTEKLRASMGTDIFTWHGFTEVYVDGAWRKATPTFNATLCEKVGVKPLDFDGHGDALLHPFDGAGRVYMQYVNDRGSYHDVPAKFLMREMARDYADMQGEDLSGRDMEKEAAEG